MRKTSVTKTHNKETIMTQSPEWTTNEQQRIVLAFREQFSDTSRGETVSHVLCPGDGAPLQLRPDSDERFEIVCDQCGCSFTSPAWI